MRTKAALALLASAASILTVITAPTATASALSCYGGALSWDAGLQDNVGGSGDYREIPSWDDPFDVSGGNGVRWYRTSNRCNDINLKINNYGGTPYVVAQVCLPSPVGCGQPYRFNNGDHNWSVIKSRVDDGTWFYVRFDENIPRFYGVIAH